MFHFLRIVSSVCILIVFHGVFAQQAFDFSDEAVINRLKEDVYTLASEEMQGREAGTQGERLAAAYIKERMQEIGLLPLFEGSFYQSLTFPGQWIIPPGNFLSVEGRVFYPGQSYGPLTISGDATASAQAVYAGRGVNGLLSENDYENLGDVDGKIFIIEYFISEELESESGLTQREIIDLKLESATDHGASGVIFINTIEEREDPSISLRGNPRRYEIPVVFASEEIFEIIEENPDAHITISTLLEREVFEAKNVAGYWDNNATTTVVIGGHYDHLGWGNSGSRSPGEPAIHYGADDNASGTAGMLEAARYLTNSTLTGNNYLFIAFSAEEKGLIGSRHFTNSEAYDMERVNYMFNYDMIGRLEDHRMSLIGTGTSPVWDDLIDKTVPEHFNIRKSPGGLGGSDHTAFYLHDIPVIFFFTGIHEDYHRPGDTPDKINYQGASEIISFSMEMIAYLDQAEPLEFTPTPAPERRTRRPENVTMGLMPDHTFDGMGMRIEAVIEDRPAQKAGIQNGDIIVRIDNIDVQEIYSYMSALEKLQRGQTVTVVVMRGGEPVELEVDL